MSKTRKPERKKSPRAGPQTPPPDQSSGSTSTPKPSAPLSLADWLRQATPEDLQELQSLIDSHAAAAPGPDPYTVRTLGQVAEWFGMELQTVKQWRMLDPPMPGQEGRWNLQEIARWRMARIKADRGDGGKAGASALRQQREIEALEINNARASLKLRKESGELVSRQAARSAIRSMFNRLRAQLEPLPEQLAPLLPNDLRSDFRRDCDQRVRLLLQQIANWRFERDVSGTGGPAEDGS